MTHGSLFSGIGGFDLAAQWMGWTNVFSVEKDEFCQKVLQHHFPNTNHYGDIKEFAAGKAANYHGRIDVLSGGFPCQPYSHAGKRLGKEDDRHLWPIMLQVIEQVQPRYVVGENVRGLINWNDGMVFDEVCADLEASGYDVQPFVLPAASVNAPHRRDRVWFVAHANSGADLRRSRGDASEGQGQRLQKRDEVRQPHISDSVRRDATNANSAPTKHKVPTRGDVPSSQDERDATDPNELRLEHGQVGGGMGEGQRKTRPCVAHELETEGQDEYATHTSSERPQQQVANRELGGKQRPTECSQRTTWDAFPTQSPICGGDDGLPTQLDGITFPKWRKESIKAYGNAVVPQLVMQIFRAIEEDDLIDIERD